MAAPAGNNNGDELIMDDDKDLDIGDEQTPLQDPNLPLTDPTSLVLPDLMVNDKAETTSEKGPKHLDLARHDVVAVRVDEDEQDFFWLAQVTQPPKAPTSKDERRIVRICWLEKLTGDQGYKVGTADQTPEGAIICKVDVQESGKGNKRLFTLSPEEKKKIMEILNSEDDDKEEPETFHPTKSLTSRRRESLRSKRKDSDEAKEPSPTSTTSTVKDETVKDTEDKEDKSKKRRRSEETNEQKEEKEKDKNEDDVRSIAPPQKRGRGRPKKIRTPEEEAERAERAKQESLASPPAKRTRHSTGSLKEREKDKDFQEESDLKDGERTYRGPQYQATRPPNVLSVLPFFSFTSSSVGDISTTVGRKYYLLTYKYVSDFPAKAWNYRGEHQLLTTQAVSKGLLMSGSTRNPPTGAVFVWQVENSNVIENFVQSDPYVRHNLVSDKTIKEWSIDCLNVDLLKASAFSPIEKEKHRDEKRDKDDKRKRRDKDDKEDRHEKSSRDRDDKEEKSK